MKVVNVVNSQIQFTVEMSKEQLAALVEILGSTSEYSLKEWGCSQESIKEGYDLYKLFKDVNTRVK